MRRCAGSGRRTGLIGQAAQERAELGGGGHEEDGDHLGPVGVRWSHRIGPEGDRGDGTGDGAPDAEGVTARKGRSDDGRENGEGHSVKGGEGDDERRGRLVGGDAAEDKEQDGRDAGDEIADEPAGDAEAEGFEREAWAFAGGFVPETG